MINAHRLRPQVSSPELRNTSQPPPYMYRTTPVLAPHRHPRPRGQVYFDQIVDPTRTHPIPQQSQQLPLPSPENLPTRPERCFSASSPSSYSSSCMSVEEFSSTKAFSLPSSPSIFSQESLTPARALSWIVFSDPHQGPDSDSCNPGFLPNPPDHNQPTVVLPYHHQSKKLASARPRRRSETGILSGPSGKNNRRLIIVDDNLVSGDSEVPSDDFEARALRQVGVTRLVRGTLNRTIALATANEEKNITKEANPSHVGNKDDRDRVFEVTCPDTGDLWKMPVIPGETLVGFAGRVKQRTGGDVILFANDDILASEGDWRAANGGGRITARLIR